MWGQRPREKPPGGQLTGEHLLDGLIEGAFGVSGVHGGSGGHDDRSSGLDRRQQVVVPLTLVSQYGRGA